MKPDLLEEIFKNLHNDFDIEMPSPDHEERFLQKLKSEKVVPEQNSTRVSYFPYFAIAMSIIICLGIFIFLNQSSETNDLASVSPELSQTQDFFTTAITSELYKVKAQRSPENEVLVSDALKQIQLLEKNYERLMFDLKESGKDQRVIYAMINNFQSRILILENVLKTIEDIQTIKQSEQNHLTL